MPKKPKTKAQDPTLLAAQSYLAAMSPAERSKIEVAFAALAHTRTIIDFLLEAWDSLLAGNFGPPKAAGSRMEADRTRIIRALGLSVAPPTKKPKRHRQKK